MNEQELIETAYALVANNEGLLIMDESNPSGNKLFAKLGIPQTEEPERGYRDMSIKIWRAGLQSVLTLPQTQP